MKTATQTVEMEEEVVVRELTIKPTSGLLSQLTAD